MRKRGDERVSSSLKSERVADQRYLPWQQARQNNVRLTFG